jgi:chemotaxis response regulator CheB
VLSECQQETDLFRREQVMDKHASPIRIVIADDHCLFRDGLRHLLELDCGIKVIGEACDGYEAVKSITDLKPDVLLLDLRMPQHTGLEVLRDLSGRSSGVRIIIADRRNRQTTDGGSVGARCPWRRVRGLGDGASAAERLRRDEWRVLGGQSVRFESRAAPARPETEHERRNEAKNIQSD